MEIAGRIVETALEYGIAKEDIIIDPLVLAAFSKQETIAVTLEAIEIIKKELGVKTMLGISNISYGLPKRSLLNRTFLAMALSKGLDLSLIHI